MLYRRENTVKQTIRNEFQWTNDCGKFNRLDGKSMKNNIKLCSISIAILFERHLFHLKRSISELTNCGHLKSIRIQILAQRKYNLIKSIESLQNDTKWTITYLADVNYMHSFYDRRHSGPFRNETKQNEKKWSQNQKIVYTVSEITQRSIDEIWDSHRSSSHAKLLN